MDEMCNFHSWSKQRGEEALREARGQSLAEHVKGRHRPRFARRDVVSAVSGALSC